MKSSILSIAFLLGSMAVSGSAAANPPSVPPDYVLIPGGWTHPSCVHEVPSGATVDAEHGDVYVGDTLIAHHDPCAHTPIPVSPASRHSDSLSGPGAYGGWVENTYQEAPTGDVWNWIEDDIVVPPEPSQLTPQTLYYFPGLESSITGNCGIIQPVLQWGISAAGGGPYWYVTDWWWSWTGQFFATNGFSVSSGHTLLAEMYTNRTCPHGSPPGCNNYTIYMEDTNTSQGVLMTASSTCEWNRAYPAVLEADSGNMISNCNQLPPSTSFLNIGLYTGPSSNPQSGYTQQTYAPEAQYPIGSNSPSCGWNIQSTSNSSILYQ